MAGSSGKNQLILLLKKHHSLGYLFVPYWGTFNDSTGGGNLESSITLSDIDNLPLGEGARAVLKLCNAFSETALLKRFARPENYRGGDIRRFFDQQQGAAFNQVVKPFIERRMSEICELARQHRILIYLKDGSNSGIYPDNRITIAERPLRPAFYFRRDEEGITYLLRLLYGEQALPLREDPPKLIAHNPLLLLAGNTLYQAEQIDSRMVQPFLQKEKVFVPARFEQKYLKGFVLKAVSKYNLVHLDGMQIVEEPAPDPGYILTLSNDLYGKPALMLSFEYGNTQRYMKDNRKVVVSMEEKNGVVTYHKMWRNYAKERYATGVLKNSGLENYQESFWRLQSSVETTGSDLIRWLNQMSPMLQQEGFTIVEGDFSYYYTGSVRMDWKIDPRKQDWFDLYMIIQLDEHTFPFADLKSNLMNRDPEYLLPGGKVFIIPDTWFTDYIDLLAFTRRSGDALQLKKQHLGLIPDKAKEGKGYSDIDRELQALYDAAPFSEIPVPQGLKTSLRQYQKEGYWWMLNLQKHGFGGCLADDMGLGKTVQTIALLQESKERLPASGKAQRNTQYSLFEEESTPANTSLLVMPTSLLFNWKSEISTFAPSLKVMVYAGMRADMPKKFDQYDVILTSYGVMRNDVNILSEFSFHYLVLDESQYVKNPFSKTYQALLQIRSDYKLALTGTPVENSLSDLWAQLHLLNNGLLGDYEDFQQRFVIPIENQNEEKQEKRLKQLIHPFVMRRRKEQVLKELPGLTEQIYWCEMSQEQEEAYERYKSGVRNNLLDVFNTGIKKNDIRILEALLRMRQMANHPYLADNDYGGDSGKFNEILRSIGNLIAEGHKALVFSSFTGHLDLLASELEDKGIAYAMLTGKTSGSGRQQQIARFQEDDKVRLFLISLKAGGTGLNLTAADYVFILDPWWNPAAEKQALSRAHRLGQSSKVFVYRFITRNSIEERMYAIQKRKKQLADTFVNFNNPFKQLSDVDIRQLLD